MLNMFSVFQVKEARISSVLSEPQRALLGYISAGQDAVSRAESDLMTKVCIINHRKKKY